MKNLKLILLFLFVISITFKTHAYEGHEENLGREGPPPAGPYKLGFKELERAIKTEKKGKIKKAKIKFEKALDHFLKANAEDPANPDILNYLGLCSEKLGFDENAEIYYKSTVSLPIFYGLKKEQQNYIIKKLISFFK